MVTGWYELWPVLNTVCFIPCSEDCATCWSQAQDAIDEQFVSSASSGNECLDLHGTQLPAFAFCSQPILSLESCCLISVHPDDDNSKDQEVTALEAVNTEIEILTTALNEDNDCDQEVNCYCICPCSPRTIPRCLRMSVWNRQVLHRELLEVACHMVY